MLAHGVFERAREQSFSSTAARPRPQPSACPSPEPTAATRARGPASSSNYWGVSRTFQAALAEFLPRRRRMAAVTLTILRERFPHAVADALALIAGFPSRGREDRQMRGWCATWRRVTATPTSTPSTARSQGALRDARPRPCCSRAAPLRLQAPDLYPTLGLVTLPTPGHDDRHLRRVVPSTAGTPTSSVVRRDQRRSRLP